tara:strand:+ start:1804 stop:2391 length:588 start_codon:yes stop_codon:yes gene_type:complete
MNQEEVKIEMNFQEDDLKSLTEMIDNMLKNDKAIEDMKSALKVLEQAQRQLSEVDIPTKMKEIGMKEFVTNKGDKIKIKSFYTGYIPTIKACLKSQELAERRQKCIDYLSKDENSSLVKNELSISFSKTQDNEAKDLKAELEKKGYAPTLNESVNANSLKSHINVVKEKGLEFDDELFKVFLKTETKIEKGNNDE